jgi:hypothetical protein
LAYGLGGTAHAARAERWLVEEAQVATRPLRSPTGCRISTGSGRVPTPQRWPCRGVASSRTRNRPCSSLPARRGSSRCDVPPSRTASSPLGSFLVTDATYASQASDAKAAEAAEGAATGTVLSADVFDDLDQLVEAVTLAAGEVDELFRSLDDGAAFGCACDRDATPAAELEQSFVAEQP